MDIAHLNNGGNKPPRNQEKALVKKERQLETVLNNFDILYKITRTNPRSQKKRK
jgi:hypothetical protein